MIPLTEFWASYHGQMALEAIQTRGSMYWEENIYKYYNRGTGNLGQACEILLENDEIVVNVKPIYSVQRDGTIREYGQDIINGIPPGPGKYSPIKGYRIKTGYYPGVPVGKFWEPWMAEFEPVIVDIVREEVTSRMRDFELEHAKRSATR